MNDSLIMGVFVLVAAMVGFRFGIAVAIFEIAAGILAGISWELGPRNG